MSEQPDRTSLLTGGCQCGAVRYALYARPEVTSVCHCRMCQKAVGGPFAALAKVADADFAWTRGRPAVFVSSSIAARGFCRDCGTPLTFRYANESAVEISIGSLDRPEAAPPSLQYGMEGRLAWLDQLNALPAQTTEAAQTSERAARFVCRQHPDHDTAPDWRPPPADEP